MDLSRTTVSLMPRIVYADIIIEVMRQSSPRLAPHLSKIWPVSLLIYRKLGHNARLKTLGIPDNKNLHVSNLPQKMNDSELSELFQYVDSDFEVLSQKTLRDSEGISRGVGFARSAAAQADVDESPHNQSWSQVQIAASLEAFMERKSATRPISHFYSSDTRTQISKRRSRWRRPIGEYSKPTNTIPSYMALALLIISSILCLHTQWAPCKATHQISFLPCRQPTMVFIPLQRC